MLWRAMICLPLPLLLLPLPLPLLLLSLLVLLERSRHPAVLPPSRLHQLHQSGLACRGGRCSSIAAGRMPVGDTSRQAASSSCGPGCRGAGAVLLPRHRQLLLCLGCWGQLLSFSAIRRCCCRRPTRGAAGRPLDDFQLPPRLRCRCLRLCHFPLQRLHQLVPC